LLEVTQLHLWRGERHVLRGLSFSLGAGQVLQLLWPNGAGKTSLLRCIAGFLQPESGHVRWEGQATSDDVPAFCVALARLSLWGARLWLLDEPVSNLDAAGQALVIESIGRHLARGGAALLSTHQPLPLTQPGCRNWLAPGDAI